jgi:hypothetical protein
LVTPPDPEPRRNISREPPKVITITAVIPEAKRGKAPRTWNIKLNVETMKAKYSMKKRKTYPTNRKTEPIADQSVKVNVQLNPEPSILGKLGAVGIENPISGATTATHMEVKIRNPVITKIIEKGFILICS